MGIDFCYLITCLKCRKLFDLRKLNDRDDFYSKYEADYCSICRLSILANEGIQKFAFLRDAQIVGYSLEDISENPELRYIEIKLTDGKLLKINVKNTRWLPNET